MFDKAIELAGSTGEALSVPYAVWAQTSECLRNYDDPMKITASRFKIQKFTLLTYIPWRT